MEMIKNGWQRVMDSRPYGVPMSSFLPFALSSLALGSLASRFWISIDQLQQDPDKREKVFKACQQLFTSCVEKDRCVDNFSLGCKVGLGIVGLISVGCALKALHIVWKHFRFRDYDRV